MVSKVTTQDSAEEMATRSIRWTNASNYASNDKLLPLQRSLHEAARKAPKRKFHALYDHLYREDILETAWQAVARNQGSAGVDGIDIATIRQAGVQGYLREMAKALKEGTYEPQPVRRVYIPKWDGDQRPLGIPTVRDRIVQTAGKLVLEPIYESKFYVNSYGFRPNRGPIAALKIVHELIWENTYILDADIERYFDSVDQEKLMELLQQQISDARMLKLINKWLKSGVQEGQRVHSTNIGVPQGGVISPLLSNIYLNQLDQKWIIPPQAPGKLTRYADDLNVLCTSEEEAEEAHQVIDSKLRKMRLRLNPSKTKVVKIGQGQGEFDFLSFTHRLTCNPATGKYQPASRPSDKALNAVRSKVERHLQQGPDNHRGYDLLRTKLKKYLTGWASYFGNCTEAVSTFKAIDQEIKANMTSWLMKKSWPGKQKAIDQLRTDPPWLSADQENTGVTDTERRHYSC